MAILPLSADATGYADSSVSGDENYNYRVFAEDSSGNVVTGYAVTTASTFTPVVDGLSADEMSSTEIDLSWTPDASLDSSSTLTIERSPDGQYWTALNGGNPLPATATGYQDQNLSPDEHYYYQVIGQNTLGQTMSGAVTTDAYTPPPPPTDVVATPAADGSSVSLTWTSNTSAAGSQSGFYIERSDLGASDYTIVDSVAAGVTSYTDGSVDDGSDYQYAVGAISADGGGSSLGYSQGRVDVPLAPPTQLTATVDGSEIDLSWSCDSQNNDGYTVEDSLSPGGPMRPVTGVSGSDVTSVADTYPPPSTTVYYQAFSVHNGDEIDSEGSNIVSVVTPPAPTPPTPLSLAPLQPGEWGAVISGYGPDPVAFAGPGPVPLPLTLTTPTPPGEAAYVTITDNNASEDDVFAGGVAVLGPDSPGDATRYTFVARPAYYSGSQSISFYSTLSGTPISLMGFNGEVSPYTPFIVEAVKGDTTPDVFAVTVQGAYDAADTDPTLVRSPWFTPIANFAPGTSNPISNASITFDTPYAADSVNARPILPEDNRQAMADSLSPAEDPPPAPQLTEVDLVYPNIPGEPLGITLDSEDLRLWDSPTGGNMVLGIRNQQKTFDSNGPTKLYAELIGEAGGFDEGSISFTFGWNRENVYPTPVGISIDALGAGDPNATIPFAPSNSSSESFGTSSADYATVALDVPTDLPTGTTVTLSIDQSVAQDIDVYDDDPAYNPSASVLMGKDANGATSYTWTVGQNYPPTEVYADTVSSAPKLGLVSSFFGLSISCLAEINALGISAPEGAADGGPATKVSASQPANERVVPVVKANTTYLEAWPIISLRDLGSTDARIDIRLALRRPSLTHNFIDTWSDAVKEGPFDAKSAGVAAVVPTDNAPGDQTTEDLLAPNIVALFTNGVGHAPKDDDLGVFVVRDYRITASGSTAEVMDPELPMMTPNWRGITSPLQHNGNTDRNLVVSDAVSDSLIAFIGAGDAATDTGEERGIFKCWFVYPVAAAAIGDIENGRTLLQFNIEWQYFPKSKQFTFDVLSGSPADFSWDSWGYDFDTQPIVSNPQEPPPT